MSDAALARREDSEAIEIAGPAPNIFGTSDPKAIVKRIHDVSEVLMEAVNQRSLSMTIGGQEFLLVEAWQFLGSMLGVTARVAWTKPLEDGSGWEAHAEAINAHEVVLGAADGMFKFAERKQSEHAARAMAQIRARRGALKSVLGFVARIGGINIPDPHGPLSAKQLKALHTLAGLHKWSDEEKHQRAGVDSLKKLTFEQASELFVEWSEGLEDLAGEAHNDNGADGSAVEVDAPSAPAENSGAAATGPTEGTPLQSTGEHAHEGSEAAAPEDFLMPSGRYEGVLCSTVAREDPEYLRSQLGKLADGTQGKPNRRAFAEKCLRDAEESS